MLITFELNRFNYTATGGEDFSLPENYDFNKLTLKYISMFGDSSACSDGDGSVVYMTLGGALDNQKGMILNGGGNIKQSIPLGFATATPTEKQVDFVVVDKPTQLLTTDTFNIKFVENVIDATTSQTTTALPVAFFGGNTHKIVLTFEMDLVDHVLPTYNA